MWGIFFMILKDVLELYHFNMDEKKTRIVRHQASSEWVKKLVKENLFDVYQATQQKQIFGDADYIISFTALDNNRALFYGLYEIKGVTEIDEVPDSLECIKIPEAWDKPPFFSYDIKEISVMDEFKDRLIIDWGKGTRSWVQTKLDKEVVEILPKGFYKPFPGYQELLLSFDELSKVINNSEANKQWKLMLSNVFGIYLILDTVTGQQYVGSASGKEGIWGRWEDYVKTKHGGDVALKALLEKYPDRYRDFQFSIIIVLPNSTLKADVYRAEQFTKTKLGSRTFGLNEN